jgi:hypothetical protein
MAGLWSVLGNGLRSLDELALSRRDAARGSDDKVGISLRRHETRNGILDFKRGGGHGLAVGLGSAAHAESRVDELLEGLGGGLGGAGEVIALLRVPHAGLDARHETAARVGERARGIHHVLLARRVHSHCTRKKNEK